MAGEYRTGIRLEGDASGYRAATQDAVRATQDLDKAQQTAAAGAKRMDEAQQVAAMGMRRQRAETNQLREATRQLPAQITDVVTSLASGQPAWMVAIQQGGQIKDAYGGVIPALRGILGLLTPLSVGLGALGIAGGAAAVGFFQGRAESAELARQLALLGPQAQTTAGQVLAAGEAVAQSSGASVGNTRELVSELLRLGPAMAQNLGVATRLGASLQRLGGGDAAEVAKGLAAASSSATDFALKASKAYGAMTAAQVDQVRQLQANGQAVAATRLVMETLADTMEQRVVVALSNHDGWLDKVTRKWSSLWDTIKGLGRTEDPTTRLRSMEAQIAEADSGGNTFGTNYAALAELRREAALLRRQINGDALRASERAAERSTEDAAIARLSPAYLNASAGLGRAEVARVLEVQRAALNRQEEATRAAFQRNEVEARAHQQRLLQIDTQRIDAEIAANDRLQAIERSRQLNDDSPEQLQRQAALVALEAQRTALVDRRRQLMADERGGRRDITPKPQGTLPGDALRAMLAADYQAAEDAFRANQAAGYEKAKLQAEESAQFRIDQERQLVEQSESMWRRMVDSWGSVNEQMKDSFERTVTAAIEAGEEAWVRFSQTGQLSVKALVDTIIAEMARGAFRQFITAGLNLYSNYSGSGNVSNTPGTDKFLNPTASSSVGSTSGRAGILSAGGSSGVQVTLINQSGTPMQASASQRGDGGIEVLLTAVEGFMADRLGAGEGPVTQALQNRYNLRGAV